MAGSLPIRLAAPLVVMLVASGCTGLASLEDGLCDAPSWKCVTSTPVFSSRAAIDEISNPPQPDALATAYDQRLKAIVAADRQQRVEKANGIHLTGIPPVEALASDHLRRYRQVSTVADGLDGGRLADVAASAPAPAERTYDRRWRLAHQTLYLGGRPADKSPKIFHFSDIQAARSEIAFRSIADAPLDVSATCDGPAVLERGAGRQSLAPGEPFAFVVPPGDLDRSSIVLVPAREARRCGLHVASGGGYRDRITILREDWRSDPFTGIDGRYDVCPSPPPAKLDALQRVFHADRWLSQTCAMKRDAIRLLSDPRDGFNAKVEALLGRRLPDSFFEAGDPAAPLDFSRAPRLSLIYVSYLDIKADFSGRIFERLLRHHAARGVPVRIIVTEILERRKDRALLERLAADFPNIQLQQFSWRPSRGSTYDEQASRFHKTHHIKLLAVLSPQPGRSRAILGGRNIHDGFLYKEPLDLSRFPDLHTYTGTNGLSLNYYSNYRDFDIEISGLEAVRALAAHFSTVWHRDAETNVSPPFSVQRAGGSAGYGYRHFISIPYADGNALERYYVELIDAARKSIEIVNPYLNPPPAIEAAFQRAIARGVRVEIIARINLKGDLGGTVLTELNEMFVAKYADRIAMFEYREPKVVLHSKLLMIDEILTVVSSVNFNYRSFIHDSENGIAIYDPAQYRRIKQVYEDYRKGSVPIDSAVDIPLRYRLLLGIDAVRQAM